MNVASKLCLLFVSPLVQSTKNYHSTSRNFYATASTKLAATKMSAAATKPKLHQSGQCLCGKVQFQVDGDIIFNQLCHCRACSRARGMSPVHLIGVRGDFKILQGQAEVKTASGLGNMEHTFCSACGGGIYQRPSGARFYAVFPVTFQLETASDDGDVPSTMLPAELQPTEHVNYENRLMNFYDALPKYKQFEDSGKMTNDGTIINE